MQKFLRKVAVFITFPILYFGTNMLLNYFIYQSQTIDIDRTKTLILGDSHTQKSLNPSYFKSAQNISQTSEPYIVTYWKLKNIVKTYIPDTIIIGFAPHNISVFNDYKFSDSKWSSEMFRRSYSIEEYSTLPKSISIDYSTFYKTLWKQTGFYPKEDHVKFIGKYTNYESSNTTDWKSVISRHYYYNGEPPGYSKVAIEYLDSIVDLSHSLGAEVILVSNPLHRSYLENIPKIIQDKYDALVHKYEGSLIIHNRSRVLFPDAYFLDVDHLNEMGAQVFTTNLIEFLKRET